MLQIILFTFYLHVSSKKFDIWKFISQERHIIILKSRERQYILN